MIPLLNINSFQSFVIKILVVVLSHLYKLTVFGFIKFSLSVLHKVVEVKLLSGGEVRVKENFMHVLMIPVLILFNISHIKGVNIS